MFVSPLMMWLVPIVQKYDVPLEYLPISDIGGDMAIQICENT